MAFGVELVEGPGTVIGVFVVDFCVLGLTTGLDKGGDFAVCLDIALGGVLVAGLDVALEIILQILAGLLVGFDLLVILSQYFSAISNVGSNRSD